MKSSHILLASLVYFGFQLAFVVRAQTLAQPTTNNPANSPATGAAVAPEPTDSNARPQGNQQTTATAPAEASAGTNASTAATATQPPAAPPKSTASVPVSSDTAGQKVFIVQPTFFSGPPVLPLDTGPIRANRRFVIAGEFGWNSLAGLGVNGSYHLIPRLAFDLGLGLSMEGYKGGVRVRGNLLESPWTPTLGVGLMYGSGTDSKGVKINVRDDTARIRILGSPYLQVVGGVNFTGRDGFNFMATAGYAFLLRHENVTLISGSRKAYDQVHIMFGGGLVLAVSLGYAL